VCAYGTSEPWVYSTLRSSDSIVIGGGEIAVRGFYASYTAVIRGVWYFGTLGSRYPWIFGVCAYFWYVQEKYNISMSLCFLGGFFNLVKICDMENLWYRDQI
jgi:hypothetical protein